MNEDLRNELLRRREIDQEVRMRSPIDVDRMHAVDAENSSFIRGVIEEHGWPGKSLVGTDGSAAAWLLIQHGPLDLQELSLPLLKAAVEQGEADRVNWAYLLDRVRMRRGEPQVYGTQFVRIGDGPLESHPIEDEATVDERRATLGLEPLAEYARRLETK